MSASSVRALLFTDIEGSTTLVRRLGERYEGVLDRHHEIIRTSAAGWSGSEQSTKGDSLFITFPSATAALEAAVDAQRRIEREPWPPDGRVRVRMGVHIGEVAESRAGLVGLAIHEAARIAGAAHGGQVIVSGDVLREASKLPTGATTRSLGTHDLRGIGQVSLYQIEHPDLQHEFPQLRTRRALVHNLPVPLTSLVGRATEADTVMTLLDDHRLVTLLGEGGCGKTRLALRVAASGLGRFVDGVWFVDLAPLSRDSDVTARIAEVLGVQGGLDGLVAALDEREVLLVLDNCEHVVGSTATLVTRLLSECAGTVVLATSRAPLDVNGEAHYHVPPLEVPRRGADVREAQTTDAVQLFIARARLVRPGFQLGAQDAEAIVELCTQLQGLPLAIELAAARLRGMALAELVGRIGDQFGLLIGGPRTGPERHRTLRNTMDWSFDLLDTDERHVLCHLASFRGGCDAESAEAVCGTSVSSPAITVDALIRLVDKSLVTTVDDNSATRYHLHQTIREYALGLLPDDAQDAILEGHARWFSVLGSRLRDGPLPGGERAWIRIHDVERDNLRAAAEWLLVRDPPAALRLLLDIVPGMFHTQQARWCDELLRAVLPLAANAPAGARAEALGSLAWGDDEPGHPSASELVADALDLLDEVDDAVAECLVLTAMARNHATAAHGDLDPDELAAAIAAADRAGGTYWPILVREYLSYKAPPATAESLIADALGLAERHGWHHFAAVLRGDLATVAQFRGDGEAALASWRAVVPVLDGLAIYEAENACYYALAEGEHGELAVGLHFAEHFALALMRSPHDPLPAAELYTVVAHLHRLAGNLASAEDALEIACRAAPPAWDFLGGLAIVTRSALRRLRGQPSRSAAFIEQACGYVGFRGLTDIPMRVVEELAAVALAIGKRQDGADLLATAREARHREHKPLSPACRPEVDALQTSVADMRGNALATPQVITVARSLVTASATQS